MTEKKPTLAGLAMKKIRRELCLTQEETAQELGVTRVTYVSWELWGITPSDKNKRRIMDFFNKAIHQYHLPHYYTITPKEFTEKSPYGKVKRSLNLD